MTEPAPDDRSWAIERHGPPGHGSALVVHVPHAATAIPAAVRADLLLDDELLAAELASLTDWHTDALAGAALSRSRTAATVFCNRCSRLVVDPERFPDDRESMAEIGMGAVYRSTAGLEPLRHPDDVRDARLLEQYFHPYAEAIADVVDDVVDRAGSCLLVDLHSYPSRALPYERDPSAPRPGVCIGTDRDHTPAELADLVADCFADVEGGVGLDTPFAGTYVPARHHTTDPRVTSVMIEIRRDLYLDEPATIVPHRFDVLVDQLAALFTALSRP